MRSPTARSAASTFSAPDERHTILHGWNDTAHAVPSATLPELFAAQVARTPDAVAVVFEDQTLSYAELDACANQLAHHLRDLGVRPETVVALCVERSLDMVVGLIGILKAGGAYLPLDPNYPPERLAFMLEDAHAPVLVTHAALLDRLPAHGARLVRLDADWPTIAQQPATAPDIILDPQHPAYVIYTSGSTGTPKGVSVTHRGIPNLAAAQIDRFAIGAKARVLQFASPSFDAADLGDRNRIGIGRNPCPAGSGAQRRCAGEPDPRAERHPRELCRRCCWPACPRTCRSKP